MTEDQTPPPEDLERAQREAWETHRRSLGRGSILAEKVAETFWSDGFAAGWEARRGREERLLKAARALIDAEFVARFDKAWERLEEETKALEAMETETAP